MPTNFLVRDEAELNAAIAAVNGGAAGVANTIALAAGFSLVTDLRPIDLPAGAMLTITGNAHLDGHGLVRGFSVLAGNVTFGGLSIAGTLAPAPGGAGWAVHAEPGVNISLIDVDFAHFDAEGAPGSAIHLASDGTLNITSTTVLDLGSITIDAGTLVGQVPAASIIGGGELGTVWFGPAGAGTLVGSGTAAIAGATTTGISSQTGTPVVAAGTVTQQQDVMITNFTVDSDASLRAAITAISLGGASAGQFNYTITLGADIALAGNLPAISIGANALVTVDGQGHTLDGEGVARGFYVYAGTVLFRSLTVADAIARGGDGEAGFTGGGGAGGLGGGLFIGQYGTAVLDGMNFRNDSAAGGNGGASIGSYVPGAASVTGVAGGFGFGGGAGVYGGAGGFGAGGGGGMVTGGAGGFGAGKGGAALAGAGGGGGLGAGGNIFVHAGGQLYIISGTLDAGTVVAGQGANGGAGGQALGGAIFLTGSQPFTLHPAAGQTVRIDGVIADTPVAGDPAGTQTHYQGGAGYFSYGFSTSTEVIYIYSDDRPPGFTAFPGFGIPDPFTIRTDPTLPGAGGTVILNGVNTYTSGTPVYGTLELGNASGAGTGTITLLAKDGLLRVHGAALPANTIDGLARLNAVALPELALVPGAYAFDPATGDIALPLQAGGIATLNTPGAPTAFLAAMATPDGTGGSRITLDYAATIAGTAAGTVAVPLPDGAYVAAAQAMLAAATVGGAAVTLVTDRSPTSRAGAATGQQLVVAGTGDLAYTAGAGSTTLVSGGGNLLANLADGHGAQTLYLGLGASTVLAGAGRATVDGNRGGKLLLAGAASETLFISHADTVGAADTVVGAGGAASVQSQGNVMVTGDFAALDFDPDAGSSLLLGLTGALRLEGDGGSALVTTDGTLAVTQPAGFATILGGGAGTRLTLAAGTPGQGSGGVASGGAGSMTVNAAYWGVLYGGTAGSNDITLTDGRASVAGGGAGDRIAFAGTARGTVFAADGPATLDGAAGSGQVTWVAGAGATTLSTGTGGSTAWLGAGTAQVATHGADTVIGGSGAATIAAGAQGVLAFAGTGALTFLNGAGASTVVGGGGALTLFGGAGGGLFCGGGNGLLTADQGAATLVGGGAGDRLVLANAADNLVVGGAGGETLGGAAATGTNAIYAGSGPDLLIAGAGTSFLFAGTGGDTLRGGTGMAQFVIQHGMAGGHITIEAMDPGHDRVALNGYPAGELAAALAGAVAAGGDTSITLSDGTEVTFLATAGLSPSSFL